LALVRIVWKRVAGEALTQHAAIQELQDQTLIVVVSDAIWQKELAAMAGQLLYRMNALLGEQQIAFIEFRIDPSALATLSRKVNTTRPTAGPPPAVPFELLSAAAAIHDAELRRAFLGAACSAVRRLEERE